MNRASSNNVATTADRQHIIDTLLANTEQFRQDAQAAFGRYSLQERQLLAGLECDTISSTDFLAAWQTVLLPQLHKLLKNVSDKAFVDMLISNLLLQTGTVQVKVDQITSQRKTELVNDFLYSLYPVNVNGKKDAYMHERERARAVLGMPELDLTTLKSHQAEYTLYKDIAQQNAVTVIDPYDSLFTKIRKNKHIKAERKKAAAYRKKRMQYITVRLALLAAMHKGLLMQLHDKQLDLVTIFDMRHQYEKKLSNLTGSQKNNPVKHLAIFETITQKYIAKQTERLAGSTAKAGLEQTKAITKELETVLLQVFDLSNAEKNQLLLYAKEYRELTQEQATLRWDHKK